MTYLKSNDGKTAIGGLRRNLPPELVNADKPTRMAAGWYDYVSTAPTGGENEAVVCVGFVRSGDDFTGIYEVREFATEEDATEADKDAALETLGVDMTEGN